MTGKVRCRDSRELYCAFACILLTCFVSYFLYCNLFGPYSDDQFFLAVYLMGYATQVLIDTVIVFGRPLGFLLLYTSLYPLYSIGKLSLAYLASCIVLSGEAFFAFIFLRRYMPLFPAVALSLIYLLFPADVSKFMFINGLYSHLSAIMFWAAAIFYQRSMTRTSALIAVSTMLVYETHLVQAAFIPIICLVWGRAFEPDGSIRQDNLANAARYYFFFFTLAGILLVYRITFARGRIPVEFSEGLLSTLEKVLTSGFWGMAAVWESHWHRIALLLSNFSAGLLPIISIVLIGNMTILRLVKKAKLLRDISEWRLVHPTLALALFLIGLILMYVSYFPFALEPERWPPTQILRRQSSVHFGAAVGYVLVWSGLLACCTYFARRISKASIITIIPAAYIAAMSAFFILHQQALVENWSLQQAYWRQLNDCILKTPAKLIVVDDREEEQTRPGMAEYVFDWTTPYVPFVMPQLDTPPRQWPLVQTLDSFLARTTINGSIATMSGLQAWYVFPAVLEFSLNDIILVRADRGALSAPPDPIEIDSRKISLRRCELTSSVPK